MAIALNPNVLGNDQLHFSNPKSGDDYALFSLMIQKHLQYANSPKPLHFANNFSSPSAFVPPSQASACYLPQTPLPVFSTARLGANKFSNPTNDTPMLINADAISQSSSSKNKLGRMYSPGRPLAMADRERILLLYERGHKISHIARIIGVTHSCVSKIMTRYRRTGSMRPRSSSGGSRSSSSSGELLPTAAAGGVAISMPEAQIAAAIKPPATTHVGTSSTKLTPSYSIQRLLFDS